MDPIYDMANNIEPLYNDMIGLYRKWNRESEDWKEADAHREAIALASHMAEYIESMPGLHLERKYNRKDFEEAADEMIEDFKDNYRTK